MSSTWLPSGNGERGGKGTAARLLAQSLLAALLGVIACHDGPATPEAGADPHAAGHAGSGATPDFACVGGTSQIIDGHATGMIVCRDGTLARSAATSCRLADLTKDLQCPLGKPPATEQQGSGQQCAKTCDEAPYGRPRFGQFEPRCAYFCATNADCPDGTTCTCDEEGVGQCVRGPCQTAADCAAGSSCRLTDRTEHCDFTGFRWLECIGPEDACVTDEECVRGAPDDPNAARNRCINLPLDGTKTCGQGGPICGRPLFVGDFPLIAALVWGPSWSGVG